jgi:hypothetical protein
LRKSKRESNKDKARKRGGRWSNIEKVRKKGGGIESNREKVRKKGGAERAIGRK